LSWAWRGSPPAQEIEDTMRLADVMVTHHALGARAGHAASDEAGSQAPRARGPLRSAPHRRAALSVPSRAAGEGAARGAGRPALRRRGAETGGVRGGGRRGDARARSRRSNGTEGIGGLRAVGGPVERIRELRTPHLRPAGSGEGREGKGVRQPFRLALRRGGPPRPWGPPGGYGTWAEARAARGCPDTGRF
jgi:hypothetical protein